MPTPRLSIELPEDLYHELRTKFPHGFQKAVITELLRDLMANVNRYGLPAMLAVMKKELILCPTSTYTAAVLEGNIPDETFDPQAILVRAQLERCAGADQTKTNCPPGEQDPVRQSEEG